MAVTPSGDTSGAKSGVPAQAPSKPPVTTVNPSKTGQNLDPVKGN